MLVASAVAVDCNSLGSVATVDVIFSFAAAVGVNFEALEEALAEALGAGDLSKRRRLFRKMLPGLDAVDLLDMVQYSMMIKKLSIRLDYLSPMNSGAEAQTMA